MGRFRQILNDVTLVTSNLMKILSVFFELLLKFGEKNDKQNVEWCGIPCRHNEKFILVRETRRK